MSLHIDYRPTSFEEIYGNETTIDALAEYLEGIKNGTKSRRSILITGPSGCGKTTIARIIASEVGAYDPEVEENSMIDFIELNASDFKGIDTIRSIRNQIKYKPMGGKYKVFFMDEAHKLTGDAQEAFLKPLEEPPSHVIFILATTNPEKLKITLKRRCAQYNLTPPNEEDLMTLMTNICEAEEKEVPEQVLEMIAQTSMCSPGVALGALDVIIDLPKKKMKAKAEEAVANQCDAIELCRLLFSPKCTWKGLIKILNKIKEQGEEAESIRRLVLSYCSSILMKSDNPKAYLVMDCFREPLYDLGFPGLVMYTYEATQAE